jgi:hypothetical protein
MKWLTFYEMEIFAIWLNCEAKYKISVETHDVFEVPCFFNYIFYSYLRDLKKMVRFSNRVFKKRKNVGQPKIVVLKSCEVRLEMSSKGIFL